jgi:hypothetical protein
METTSESARRLRAAIDEGLLIFAGADDALTALRPRPDQWCAREVLGHLIDSACNNHRRFVLGHAAHTTRWDGYEQELWVSSQRYADEAWTDLVALWVAYNRHLACVMASTPPEVAEREALSPEGSGQVSVRFLMDDYVSHLRQHLGQIRTLLKS